MNEQTISQTPPSVIPSPATNTSKVSIPLMLFLILISLMIGVFIGKETKKEEKLSLTTPTISVPKKEISPTIKLTEAPTISQQDWELFPNSDLGISFSYPKKFGVPQLTYDDSAKRPKNPLTAKYDTGKAIYISFPAINYPSNKISISAYTDDFNAWQWTKPERTCPQDHLVERNSLDNKFYRQCKNIKLPNGQYVMANNFSAPECSPLFNTCIYISNPKEPYKNIDICLHFNEAEYLKTFDCRDEQKINNAYRLIETLSENIMKETGLSSKDTNDLQDLLKIVSSLKFLN